MKIRESRYPKELQLCLETMLRAALQGRSPCVLPRLAADKQLWFYVVADDKRQLTEMMGVMRAYLGAVRTKSDPQLHIDATDETEDVLIGRWPQGFLKIAIPLELNSQREEVYSVFKTINVALARYGERPQSVAVTQRPIGRILSDFFIACDRNDGKGAEAFLGELKTSGRMSARNLLSIELQTLAARNDWKGVLAHPRLEDILSRRIPARVTEILLEALGRTEMRSSQPADYQTEALRARLEPVCALFMRSPGLAICGNEDRWRVWAIGAVAFGYARAIAALPQEVLGAEWINQLRQWGGLHQEAKPVARDAAEALDVAPNIEGAVYLLKRSLALDPQEGLAIYRRLSAFPAEILKEIEGHRVLGSVWRTLQDDFAPQRNIDSWPTWLSSLLQRDTEQITVQTLSDVCRQWEPGCWDEEAMSRQLLSLADSGDSRRFREGIPVLRGWLQDRRIQTSASFVAQMLLVLAVDEVHSTQDLVLTADLIGDLTNVAHTKEQYRESINAVIEIWNRTKSIKSLDDGLDLMDVLLDSVCADAQARLSYWTVLQEFCLTEWRRLTDQQQLLVREASEAISGSSTQFPAVRTVRDSRGGTRADPGPKRLAIYTLTEGAGRRAKAVLSELFPHLDIQLNHDKSATSALINLAKTADYFVFSAQSAAHQAFYPVVHRRDDILYPSGKGSSSIVRCFLDAIER
jgi:hypothetical protein